MNANPFSSRRRNNHRSFWMKIQKMTRWTTMTHTSHGDAASAQEHKSWARPFARRRFSPAPRRGSRDWRSVGSRGDGGIEPHQTSPTPPPRSWTSAPHSVARPALKCDSSHPIVSAWRDSELRRAQPNRKELSEFCETDAQTLSSNPHYMPIQNPSLPRTIADMERKQKSCNFMLYS